MEWMATITGDHVGYPRFWDLWDFSPTRKIFGSKNSRVFQRQIFAVESFAKILKLLYFIFSIKLTKPEFVNGKALGKNRGSRDCSNLQYASASL